MVFFINGVEWHVVFVPSGDANLARSDGSITVGVTDWNDKCVYLSRSLKGAFLRRVMAHELCHCFCFSYEIKMNIEEEERMADWISIYGEDLVYMLDSIMHSISSASETTA